MSVFFSVLIPSYNRGSLIVRTVESVLNQSCPDLEVIVVDDGSSDNTGELMAEIKDPRLRYFYKKNGERSAARNYGMERAEGRYYLFLDSDDVLDRECLQALYDKIEERGFPVAVFSPEIKYYEENENAFTGRIIPFFREGVTPREILEGFHTIQVPQCIERSIAAGFRFEEKLNLWEDTHFYLRIFSAYTYIPVPGAIVKVMLHPGSTVYAYFREIKMSNAMKYIEGVEDVQKYTDTFPPAVFAPLFRNYLFRKLQMSIYVALKNRQYDVAGKILDVAGRYSSWNIYFLKTRGKIFLGRSLGIHINR